MEFQLAVIKYLLRLEFLQVQFCKECSLCEVKKRGTSILCACYKPGALWTYGGSLSACKSFVNDDTHVPSDCISSPEGQAATEM